VARKLRAGFSPVAIESYVSAELTRKLRAQQRGLRLALRRLEQRASACDSPQLSTEVVSLASQYRAHEALVDALLEAVEPDYPVDHLLPEEPLP
jgi:hypothetical protein